MCAILTIQIRCTILKANFYGNVTACAETNFDSQYIENTYMVFVMSCMIFVVVCMYILKMSKMRKILSKQFAFAIVNLRMGQKKVQTNVFVM